MYVLRDPATAKICAKHVSFEVDPSRSSCKAPFQGLSLQTALLRMSFEKVAPAGLKHQECENGRSGEKALIKYVPEQDPVQEALT